MPLNLIPFLQIPKNWIAVLGAFLVPCAVPLFAQSDTLSQRLDQVVVTGMRTQTNRSNVPMTITVVDRAEIEESSESALLPVLSERVPGMFVSERGVTGFGVAAGGAGAITLRGVGGSPTSQLLVLIDGHPQFMGMMGHHLPDAYVASDVERVEVIRGPASILYGTNAMGGVINIITRKQRKEGWSANGRVMGGSFHTQKYLGNAGLRKGAFDGFVSLNHDQTKGHRINSDFRITNGYNQLGYQLSDHFRVSVNMSLAGYKAQNPGTSTLPMLDNIADIVRGVASVSMENHYEKSSGAFLFFSNFGDHKINDGYNITKQPKPKDFYFRSTDHNYGVTLYQVFHPFVGNMLTTGVDYKNYGGHAWNDYLDGRPVKNIVDTNVYELAGYLIMQQNLLEKLTLNAGVRLEHHQLFGNEWVPQVGLAYRYMRHTVLKASVAKGFRSPTILELYMWAPANKALRPERMLNYEVSVGQGFWEGRLSAELTGFLADGSNLIKSQLVDGKLKNMNSGSFKNSGLELSIAWAAMQNLRIQANYSYLHMREPVLYAPGQRVYLAASYHAGKWVMSANFQYIDELYTLTGEHPLTESYGLLNAKLSHRPVRWVEAFVKGENLTNKEYETMREFPMPGVTLFLGLNIHLN